MSVVPDISKVSEEGKKVLLYQYAKGFGGIYMVIVLIAMLSLPKPDKYKPLYFTFTVLAHVVGVTADILDGVCEISTGEKMFSLDDSVTTYLDEAAFDVANSTIAIIYDGIGGLKSLWDFGEKYTPITKDDFSLKYEERNNDPGDLDKMLDSMIDPPKREIEEK